MSNFYPDYEHGITFDLILLLYCSQNRRDAELGTNEFLHYFFAALREIFLYYFIFKDSRLENFTHQPTTDNQKEIPQIAF